ncbi:MAG: RNA methyltransferase [Eubacteriales bacterium]|nr:RNA methyltransferase [Eubacteriales bacterium]
MPDKESDKFASSNILEGFISIRSLIEAREAKINDRPIYKIIYDITKNVSKRQELDYLKSKAAPHNFTIEAAEHDVIKNQTTGNTHGGIIALCGERGFAPIAGNILPRSFYIMLEGIEDPYNFGYALRSVYAAGAAGVILSPRNWMGAAGVVCRASAGASELIPMYIYDDAETINLFREAGYKIICAEKRNAVSVYESDLRFPVFLIIGGEKRGISRSLRDTADTFVKLDYARPFKSALSAASAASIMAYEVFRQNRV